MFCHTEVYDAVRTLRVIYWVTFKNHLKNMWTEQLILNSVNCDDVESISFNQKYSTANETKTASKKLVTERHKPLSVPWAAFCLALPRLGLLSILRKFSLEWHWNTLCIHHAHYLWGTLVELNHSCSNLAVQFILHILLLLLK